MKKLILSLARILAITALGLLAACSGGESDVVVEDLSPITPLNPTGDNPYGEGKLINTHTALLNYCPRAETRRGTNFYRVVDEAEEEVRFQASITKISRECLYEGKKLNIRVGVKAKAITGAAGESGAVNFPFRVVVRQPECLYFEKVYERRATFAAGVNSVTFSLVTEKITIPAPRETNVLLYVGFESADVTTEDLPKCSS